MKVTHKRTKGKAASKKGLKKASDHSFYGVSTVGERGQVVIPAEARKNLNFKKGEKLIVFSTDEGMLIFANALLLKGTIKKLTELIKPFS